MSDNAPSFAVGDRVLFDDFPVVCTVAEVGWNPSTQWHRYRLDFGPLPFLLGLNAKQALSPDGWIEENRLRPESSAVSRDEYNKLLREHQSLIAHIHKLSAYIDLHIHLPDPKWQELARTAALMLRGMATGTRKTGFLVGGQAVIDVPRHLPHCDGCVFLGCDGEIDFWFCPVSNPTLLVAKNASGDLWMPAALGDDPDITGPLRKAAELARDRGFPVGQR